MLDIYILVMRAMHAKFCGDDPREEFIGQRHMIKFTCDDPGLERNLFKTVQSPYITIVPCEIYWIVSMNEAISPP
jgi:hypothetical protein